MALAAHQIDLSRSIAPRYAPPRTCWCWTAANARNHFDRLPPTQLPKDSPHDSSAPSCAVWPCLREVGHSDLSSAPMGTALCRRRRGGIRKSLSTAAHPNSGGQGQRTRLSTDYGNRLIRMGGKRQSQARSGWQVQNEAALIGYQHQRDQIEAKIAEIRRELAGETTGVKATGPTGAPFEAGRQSRYPKVNGCWST